MFQKMCTWFGIKKCTPCFSDLSLIAKSKGSNSLLLRWGHIDPPCCHVLKKSVKVSVPKFAVVTVGNNKGVAGQRGQHSTLPKLHMYCISKNGQKQRTASLYWYSSSHGLQNHSTQCHLISARLWTKLPLLLSMFDIHVSYWGWLT